MKKEQMVPTKSLFAKTDFASGNAGAASIGGVSMHDQAWTISIGKIIVAQTNPGIDSMNMDQGEVAHRIVAAWNFVQGIATSQLTERSAVGALSLKNKLQRDVDALQDFVTGVNNMIADGPFNLKDSPKSMISNLARLIGEVREVIQYPFEPNRARMPFLSPYIYIPVLKGEFFIPVHAHGDGSYGMSAMFNDNTKEVFFTEGHVSACNSPRAKVERRWVQQLIDKDNGWYPVSYDDKIPNVEARILHFIGENKLVRLIDIVNNDSSIDISAAK